MLNVAPPAPLPKLDTALLGGLLPKSGGGLYAAQPNGWNLDAGGISYIG